MRGFTSCLLFAVFAVASATASSWPWPWSKQNTTTITTTTIPGAIDFEQGVAAALGFDDITNCYKDTRTGMSDLREAVQDYEHGGFVSKGKALVKFGEGIHLVVDGLSPCGQIMTDGSKYKLLMKYLMNPRYYTIHNALTLALNLAEDRHQLTSSFYAWDQGDYRTAGFNLVNAAMDVLLNPGIPSSNGTAAVQIGLGLAEGFTSDVPLKCFTDLSVEVPAIFGGVLDIASVAKALTGFESLFHGIEGLVPCYKQCMADRAGIVSLLHELEDVRHPAELAKKVMTNLEKNGVDLALDTASAILAYKGSEWQRFGLEIGRILGKAFIIPQQSLSASWPWPWSKRSTTSITAITTTPMPEVNAFEQGVAAALGFDDITSCYTDSRAGMNDLRQAVEDYEHGGFVSKGKALVKFGEGIHLVVDGLSPCSQIMTDASKYKALIKYLMDPRYYTIHNALTLALNLAEDRRQLASSFQAWDQGNYRTAGFELVNAALNVLLNPGIPSANGTTAVQIGIGLAEGFTSDVPLKCFTDLSVEVPAIVGGVLDIASVAKALAGFESLFHGIEGLVPCYKQCMSDRAGIVSLLHELEDLRHPAELAKKIMNNLEENGVDISLDIASAILAYKGGEWRRFGLEIGRILGKAFVINDKASSTTRQLYSHYAFLV